MRGNGRNTRNRPRNGGPVSRAAFRALEARLNPDIKAVPTSGQPRPVTGPGDFWISRRVQLTLSGNPGAALNCTVGDIIKQLTSATGTFPLRICSVTCYGPMGGSLTTTLNTQNFTTLAGGTNAITSSDYGSAVRMPGLRFTIPKLISQVLAASPTSTVVIASSTWSGGVAPSVTGNVVFDVDVVFQLP